MMYKYTAGEERGKTKDLIGLATSLHKWLNKYRVSAKSRYIIWSFKKQSGRRKRAVAWPLTSARPCKVDSVSILCQPELLIFECYRQSEWPPEFIYYLYHDQLSALRSQVSSQLHFMHSPPIVISIPSCSTLSPNFFLLFSLSLFFPS